VIVIPFPIEWVPFLLDRPDIKIAVERIVAMIDSLEEPNRVPLRYIKEWLVGASQKKSPAANAKSLLNAPLESLVLDAVVGPGVQSAWEQLKKQVGAMQSIPVVDLTRAPSSEDIARVAATAALASQQALAANQRVQADVNGPRGVPEAHQLPKHKEFTFMAAAAVSTKQDYVPTAFINEMLDGGWKQRDVVSLARRHLKPPEDEPEIQPSLSPELVKTIFNVNLSNGGETTVRGLQKGISPFSFLAKDEEVIEKEKEDQEDFDGADRRTTEDVKNHRKKFALFLPQNGDQLVVCLNTYTYAASKIVGSKCDHLVETKAVTKKIRASPTFRNWNKRQVLTVLWAIHTDSRSFFLACERWSPGDDLPQSELHYMVSELGRGILLERTDCPVDTFYPKYGGLPPTPRGALKRRGGGGVGSGFQKGDQDDQQQGMFSAGSGMPSSPDIHPDFQLLLEPLTDKYGHVSVDDICDAANTPSDNLPYLSIAGSARNMCYQHLLGECTSRECRQYRYHATTEELDDDPNFRKALSEKLKPGVIKLMTDAQGSRKRVWEQT